MLWLKFEHPATRKRGRRVATHPNKLTFATLKKWGSVEASEIHRIEPIKAVPL